MDHLNFLIKWGNNDVTVIFRFLPIMWLVSSVKLGSKLPKSLLGR